MNAYLKEISYYLDRDLIYWNYKPREEPFEIYVYKGALMNNRRTIYVPCKYKNKYINIKEW